MSSATAPPVRPRGAPQGFAVKSGPETTPRSAANSARERPSPPQSTPTSARIRRTPASRVSSAGRFVPPSRKGTPDTDATTRPVQLTQLKDTPSQRKRRPVLPSAKPAVRSPVSSARASSRPVQTPLSAAASRPAKVRPAPAAVVRAATPKDPPPTDEEVCAVNVITAFAGAPSSTVTAGPSFGFLSVLHAKEGEATVAEKPLGMQDLVAAFLAEHGDPVLQLPPVDNAQLRPFSVYATTAGQELTDDEYFGRRALRDDARHANDTAAIDELERLLVRAKLVADRRDARLRAELGRAFGPQVEQCANPAERSLLVVDNALLSAARLVELPSAGNPAAVVSNATRSTATLTHTARPAAAAAAEPALYSPPTQVLRPAPAKTWMPRARLVQGISHGSIDDIQTRKEPPRRTVVASVKRPATESNPQPRTQRTIVATPAQVRFAQYTAGETLSTTLKILNQRDTPIRLRMIPDSVSPFFHLATMHGPVGENGGATEIAPGISTTFTVTLRPSTEAVYAWGITAETSLGDSLYIPVRAALDEPALTATLVASECAGCTLPVGPEVKAIQEGAELRLSQGCWERQLDSVVTTWAVHNAGETTELVVLDSATAAKVAEASNEARTLDLHTARAARGRPVLRSDFEETLWRIVRQEDDRASQTQRAVQLGAFSVSPQRLVVPRGETVHFKVTFSPSSWAADDNTEENPAPRRWAAESRYWIATSQCQVLALLVDGTAEEPRVTAELETLGGLEVSEPVRPDAGGAAAAWCSSSQSCLEANLGEQSLGGVTRARLRVQNTSQLSFAYAWRDEAGGSGALAREIRIEPSAGVLAAGATASFNVTFAPARQRCEFHDVFVLGIVRPWLLEGLAGKTPLAVKVLAAAVPLSVQLLPPRLAIPAQLAWNQSYAGELEVRNQSGCDAAYELVYESAPAGEMAAAACVFPAVNAGEAAVSHRRVVVPARTSVKVAFVLTALGGAGPLRGSLVARSVPLVPGQLPVGGGSCARLCTQVAAVVVPRDAAAACDDAPLELLGGNVSFRTRAVGQTVEQTLVLRNRSATRPARFRLGTFALRAAPAALAGLPTFRLSCSPSSGLLPPASQIVLRVEFEPLCDVLVHGGIELYAAQLAPVKGGALRAARKRPPMPPPSSRSTRGDPSHDGDLAAVAPLVRVGIVPIAAFCLGS